MSMKESIAYYMEHLSSSVDQISWYASTSLLVYYHVIQFITNLDDNDGLASTIRRLNNLASQRQDLKKLKPQQLEVIKVYMEKEVERIFIYSFVPEVRRFFKVPQLLHLSEKDRSLQQNEILAGFLVFLLQILDSESPFWSSYRKHLNALLQKNLTFILTILGDTPFWCSGLEDVNDLLVECESVANEAGCFIYSCVFASREKRNENFDGGIDALLENIHTFLNEKLKNHCFNLSNLPEIATVRSLNSPFVVDFLLEDLESLMNGLFGLTINNNAKCS